MKINPVLRKELKLTVRSFRTALMVMIYTAAVAFVTMAMFYGTSFTGRGRGVNLQNYIYIYIAIACLESGLLLFIVPSLTASTISGERERQTLDILLSTKLSPFSIILGKLMASLSKVILLIISTIPMFSIIFIYGGVSIGDVLKIVSFLIVTTIFVGSIGVLISTFFKSTKGSTAMTYALVFFIVLGTLIIAAVYISYIFSTTMSNKSPEIPFWLYINPAIGFLSILYNQVGDLPFILGATNGLIGIKNAWIYNIIVQGVLSVVFLYLASIRLNPLNSKRFIGKNIKNVENSDIYNKKEKLNKFNSRRSKNE
ncbi:ABC-2 family transporter protein [Clostridium cavendishii DSM 21758]|uniref:ABC-2 family transporter protein n=1 Tax=Clostridium cavendishii DSM 21758 TaxID=1121302 RepID=A0A1M6D0D3_9CLOT|nr:ABC transporter permease subunit [Clostridium cavendishii]SHI66669.1 ABC-2 family transporter protein [Clostridium cavendishii DSM 21758]